MFFFYLHNRLTVVKCMTVAGLYSYRIRNTQTTIKAKEENLEKTEKEGCYVDLSAAI